MTYRNNDYSPETLKARRRQMIKTVGLWSALGVAAVAGAWTVGAIDRIDEGNFGIGRSVSGVYQNDIIDRGLSVNYLTKVFEIDGKSNMVHLEGVRPKTNDGPLLENLDANIIYNVNENGSIDFVRHVKDLTREEDRTYSLGKTMVTNIGKRITTETIAGFSSSSLVETPSMAEEAIKRNLQKSLDDQFGKGLFEIVGVNLSNVQLNPATEQRIAAVAAQEASKAIAAVQLESLDQRKKAELAEAEALVSISKDTGVAIGDLIELRRIRMMSDMPSGAVQPVVSADRKPPSP